MFPLPVAGGVSRPRGNEQEIHSHTGNYRYHNNYFCWYMLMNWEVFGMNVNKSARHICKPPIAIYRCGLHKLLILTAGCSHFVSIKQRKAATDQIISTRSWITPLLLLGKCCVAQRVPRRIKKRWRRPLFLTICSKTRACLTHRLCGVRLHPWCSWHVARETQKDRERDGSPKGPASFSPLWVYTVCGWFH